MATDTLTELREQIHQPKKDTVAVAYIHPASVSADFMGSLMQLVAWDTLRGPGRILYGGSFISMASGPNLSSGRNKIVEGFLNGKADWLWMVDSDMTFEPDTLERLLEAADKDERPIVGGLCHGKKMLPSGDSEYFPTLYYFAKDDEGNITGDSWRLQEYPLDEMLQVDATGAACLLIHRSVLEEMARRTDVCPLPHRWFQETVMKNKPWSEDITFCVRAQLCGFPVYVHTGVEMGHIKAEKITARTYWEWRENEIREPQFVITGTGRSGSGYISKAFDMLGIRCGHEEWWNPFNRRHPRLVGDSSWLATPHLEDYEGKIGLQLRHPLKVLSSLMNGQIFGEGADKENPYLQYKAKHCDFTGDELRDAALYVADWVEMGEKHADKVWKLEDLDGDLFSDIVEDLSGYEVEPDLAERALKSVPKTHNKHPDGPDYSWEDLPDGEPFDRLRAIAKRYGYE